MYNVLWIDDEYEKMRPFSMMCSTIYGIKLTGYKYREEGMHHLEQELNKWDAVLLDAKMLEKSDDETPNIKGLRKSIDKIHDLSLKHYLPYFISTGQPDLMSNEMFEDSFGKFYVKEHDDDKLISDMLETMKNSPRKKLKLIYSDVVDAIHHLGMDEYAIDNTFDILEAMHNPAEHNDFKPVKYYNLLRQTLEYLFRACAKYGLVPPQCIPHGTVNLMDSSLYLAGQDTRNCGVRYGERSGNGKIGEHIVPSYIGNIIRQILEVGNIHSHTVELSETDTKTLEIFFNTMHDNYYIFGLNLQLCEVIVWFSNYVSAPEHADKEKNLSKCISIIEKNISDVGNAKQGIDHYEGLICEPERDAVGNYHYDECFLSIKEWQEGRKLKLVRVSRNTNSYTKNYYPYFAYWEKI